MSKLFISYTGDLREECQAVKDIVGSYFVLEPIDLFDYKVAGPSSESVLRRIEKEIKGTDFFVLFLGPKYGSLCSTGPGETLSYTEFEYRQAKRHWDARQKPEIYAFLKNSPETPEERQARLMADVSSAHVYQPYDHLDTVKLWIFARLKTLLAAEEIIDRDDARVTRIIYIVLAAFALFCMAGLVFLNLDPLRVGMALAGSVLLIVLAKFVL